MIYDMIFYLKTATSVNQTVIIIYLFIIFFCLEISKITAMKDVTFQ